MEKLLIMLILFSTFLSKEPEYITIEHVGISDKPIAPIIISTTGIHKADNECLTTTKKVYNDLKSIILSCKCPDYKGNDYGSFKVTTFTRSGKRYSCFLNRQKSIELFSRLISVLQKEHSDSNILSELLVLKRRIVF